MCATRLMAQTEARITTSVLINRASAMRSSDACRAHCIVPICRRPDGRQIPPILEKCQCSAVAMADNRQCVDGERSVTSILQASRSEGYGIAAARSGNDARAELGVTGHGYDQSDRYDHGD